MLELFVQNHANSLEIWTLFLPSLNCCFIIILLKYKKHRLLLKYFKLWCAVKWWNVMMKNNFVAEKLCYWEI